MIDLVLDDEKWLGVIEDAPAWAARCFDAVTAHENSFTREIALLLTDDAKIQDLNKEFRSIDRPTNVLAFPCDEPGPVEFLGDIAMAREICLAEAIEKGIAPIDHATHLLVHGMLHLIGYDHEKDDEAEKMEDRETQILQALGVQDPYASIRQDTP